VRFLFALALIIPLGTWVGAQTAYRCQEAAVWRRRNDADEKELHRLRLQNQRIEHDVKALDTRAGVMRAARAQGWVLPGEKPLRIPDH